MSGTTVVDTPVLTAAGAMILRRADDVTASLHTARDAVAALVGELAGAACQEASLALARALDGLAVELGAVLDGLGHQLTAAASGYAGADVAASTASTSVGTRLRGSS